MIEAMILTTRYWIDFPTQRIKDKFLERYKLTEDAVNGKEEVDLDLIDFVCMFSKKYTNRLFYISWVGTYSSQGICLTRNGKQWEERVSLRRGKRPDFQDPLTLYSYKLDLLGESSKPKEKIIKELRESCLWAECVLPTKSRDGYKLSDYPKDELLTFSKKYPTVTLRVSVYYPSIEELNILKAVYHFKNGEFKEIPFKAVVTYENY